MASAKPCAIYFDLGLLPLRTRRSYTRRTGASLLAGQVHGAEDGANKSEFPIELPCIVLIIIA